MNHDEFKQQFSGFCAEGTFRFKAIENPFTQGGNLYATDGSALAWIPAPGVPDDPPYRSNVVPDMQRVIALAAKAGAFKDYPYPDAHCGTCNDTGKITQAICDECDGTGNCSECDGEGEVECACCGHTNECDDCDGTGKCPTCNGNPDGIDAETVNCPDCQDSPVFLDGTKLNRRYARILNTVSGLRYTMAGEAFYFVSGELRILIMPLR